MSRESKPLVSEKLAKMLGTNPAVVRRTMGSLRERNYVTSEKGHGGGWRLSCDLKNVSLLDIYEAVGKPEIFALGITGEKSECLIEQVVQETMQLALSEAEQVIIEKFGNVSLADLEEQLEPLLNQRNSKSRKLNH